MLCTSIYVYLSRPSQRQYYTPFMHTSLAAWGLTVRNANDKANYNNSGHHKFAGVHDSPKE